MEKLLKNLDPLLYNGLTNYIVPGLESYLIGEGENGRVRLFNSTRETLEWITPHSHRFDFTALVLKGIVRNCLFAQTTLSKEEWVGSTITQVCGASGINEYEHMREPICGLWERAYQTYTAGEVYSMSANEIHSIKFNADTVVLIFEGPQLTSSSYMLEPWVNQQAVPTFRTENWMFKKIKIKENENGK